MPPKIGLVLGGGGSRGIAHIGVLQVLTREQIPIDLIIGTSMGAIVGALFALGIPPADLERYFSKWQGNTLFSMNLFSARARQRVVQEQIETVMKGKTFADLAIPTVVMAVDMNTGREVALKEGLVTPALLASSAVPAVFPTVEIDGMQLADGGVIDSLATHVAFYEGAEKVIAVDIYPQLEQNGWSDPLGAIMGVDLPFNLLASNPISKSPSMVSSLWRSIRIMTWNLHATRISAHPPDVLLRPDVGRYGSLDFKDVKSPLAAGIAEAERCLPQIKALLEHV
jgi:NTE family protein